MHGLSWTPRTLMKGSCCGDGRQTPSGRLLGYVGNLGVIDVWSLSRHVE